MTSLAESYWQIFLAQGICTGQGMGVMYMRAVTVVGTYFARKRTMVLAMSAAGGGTGSVVFPAIVQYLTPQVGESQLQLQKDCEYNLRKWCPRLPLGGPLCRLRRALLLHPYQYHTPTSSPTPKNRANHQMGCLPRGALRAIRHWHVSHLLGSLLRLLLRKPRFSVAHCQSLLDISSQINTFALNVMHLTALEAVNLLLLTNAVGIPVRPLLGYISDRWCGPINLFIPLSAILGLMVYSWMAVHTRAGIYAFTVVYGLATAAVQGIFVGALASLTKDLSKTGTRFGMVCSILASDVDANPSIAYAGGLLNPGVDKTHGSRTRLEELTADSTTDCRCPRTRYQTLKRLIMSVTGLGD